MALTREKVIENIKGVVKNYEHQVNYNNELAENVEDETLTLKQYYKDRANEMLEMIKESQERIKKLESTTEEDTKKIYLDKLTYVKENGFKDVKELTMEDDLETIKKEFQSVKMTIDFCNCYMNRSEWIMMN